MAVCIWRRCVSAPHDGDRRSLRYALERRQFGKRIAEFQLIQAMLADSQTEYYAGKCMVEDAARRYDAGRQIGTEASCCKLHCSEMAGRVADRGCPDPWRFRLYRRLCGGTVLSGCSPVSSVRGHVADPAVGDRAKYDTRSRRPCSDAAENCCHPPETGSAREVVPEGIRVLEAVGRSTGCSSSGKRSTGRVRPTWLRAA